jgi:hypothetical protein
MYDGLDARTLHISTMAALALLIKVKLVGSEYVMHLTL